MIPRPDDPGPASPAAGSPGAPRRRSTTTLRTRLVLLVLAVAVVSGAVGWRMVTAMGDHDRARDRADNRLTPSLGAVDGLTGSLVDQETGLRGFVITGDEQFLEPYRTGQGREAAHLGALRAALADDAALTARVERLAGMAQDWRRGVAEPEILLVRAQDPAATAPPAARDAKQRFDALRTELAGLRDTVTALVATARTESDAAGERLRLTLAVSLGLVAVALATVAATSERVALQPIERLRGHVRRVAGGELDHRVPPEGPPDLAELARAVEAMRVRILREAAEAGASRDALDEANQALARTNAELCRSNGELSEFAYVVSHDLSEPLRVIRGFSDLLVRDHADDLDGDALEYLEHIADGAARMRAMLDGLLEVSRAGRAALERGPVDLAAVLDDVALDLGAAVAETGATVTVGRLPVVEGDPRQLHRLFLNLVANAVKYHRPGVAPEVTVTAEAPDAADGGWRVTVADNGIGIPERSRDRVFAIFQRLHQRDEYSGSGIGLAVCRKIAERHGATIAIGDNLPQGTRFVVTFPAGAGDRPAAAAPAERTPVATSS